MENLLKNLIYDLSNSFTYIKAIYFNVKVYRIKQELQKNAVEALKGKKKLRITLKVKKSLKVTNYPRMQFIPQSVLILFP